MNGFSLYSDPGYTALIETGDWEGLYSAMSGEKNLLVRFATIDSTAVDSGNTPTTTLRAGTIMAIKASDGNWYPYDADATDGTQIARGVLPFQLSMIGPLGVVTDKSVPIIVRANFKVAELHNYDAAAGKALIALGCVLDAPAGANALIGPLGYVEKASNYTVVAADNGVCFLATTGAVTFTLPTKAPGLAYEFYNTVDANMVVSSAGSADDIIAIGDAAGDTITFSTSNQKIGSHCRVVCAYLGGSLKWLASNLGGTTATVA